ncbi:heavy metal translocating P-type ATPase [Reyranella sp.]|jgi:Zn2+/Cd2+-exporting ATPase|uniref:heavy metal translocating P-type ATPase n=1 Tax=Reyranella sp. TaxID=1929291 RepID=UPI003783E7B4
MATASPTSAALRLRVEGMDCSACALKIETALNRLPGLADINVNYATEMLSLQVDENRTSLAAVEGKIRSLGYVPIAMDDTAARQRGGRDESDGRDQPWWRTRKGRTVLGLAALLAAAAAISVIKPEYSFWAYGVAAIVGVVPIARRAFAGTLSGTPFTIETLMTVAAVGALAIEAAEEAAVVIFLFAVGELLETVAAGRARAGIKALIDLVPRVARIEEAGEIKEVPIERLRVGDTVVVRPGDRIPSDGEVIDGQSEVNEAPVTGESVPAAKAVGDKVFAGSVNANGMLRVRLTHAAADNTIARIIHVVEEAQASKAPTARFIDRFSAWYTPAAMAAAGLVMIGPPLMVGADWHTWIYRGLATLLIACPCALVISTPAAIASGLAAGARRGLLVKGGAALEMLGKVKTIAFDKTGTLTGGHPRVTDVVAIDGIDADVLAKAAAVERGSSHPLGVAIEAEAEARSLDIPRAFGGSVATPGKAVTGRIRSGFVSVGSPRHAAEQGELAHDVRQRIEALEGDGKTVVVVSEGKRPLGLIALRDEPRPDAEEGLARLRALGVTPVMLTGDNARTAAAISATLGIEYKAELLPDAKLEAIAAYKSQAPIAMVGDGINDAPALAASSVGIAMGGGTDVALETAEAALLKNRLVGVAELLSLSRATLANIWQNITIALGLKGVFLLTTLLGATPLWMAILADTGATVLVTANALRLLRQTAPSDDLKQ